MRTLKLILLTSLACAAADDAAIFADQLRPILARNCAGCHAGKQVQGGLSVESLEALLRGGKRGPAIEPGSSARSLLLKALRGEGVPKMPLGGAMDDAAAKQMAAAIDAMKPQTATRKDAHWEWLLRLPKTGSALKPDVRNTDWVRNPIDTFVLARLEREGMKPAAEAERRVLIRRLYFDLIGLPPSPEEIRAFEEDRDPQAYEHLVDRLLTDSRYGERWGRHWLDLVRFAESDGFAIDGERPTAWRYRDYVIRAFNSDKPYDVFVREQIAGDEFRGKGGGSAGERAVALGFLRMGPWEADANSKKQLRQDFLNEVTATVGSVFLGLTTGCAQCHNHKYDPISHRDYYRLQAFFAATATAEVPAPHDASGDDAKEMKRRVRRHEDDAEAAEAELDKQKEELKQQYIRLMKVKPDDPAVGKFLGRLGTKNFFFLEQDLPLVKEPEWRGPIKAYFDTRDRMQRNQELARRYQPVAYAVRDMTPPATPDVPDTYVLVGGDLVARGEKVEPGFLQCVTNNADAAAIPFAGGSSGRRTALAEWIASAENPFAARVMANRIWMHHFGEGIVRTPSDFGKNGDAPSHPELLDWLAAQFVEQKWSVKAMHRLMLQSSTYRQASRHDAQGTYVAKDATNRLLWRMNWQRLDSEALRDSILHLSGRLTTTSGGPGVFFDVPDDVARGFEFFKWFPSTEEERRRRSVYQFQRRSVQPPMAEEFDAPNLSASCSRRQATIVAPQALTLLNGPLTRTEAAHLAARLAKEGSTGEERLTRGFQLVLGRGPTEVERAHCRKLVDGGAAGLASLAAVLFNLNEFLYLE